MSNRHTQKALLQAQFAAFLVVIALIVGVATNGFFTRQGVPVSTLLPADTFMSTLAKTPGAILIDVRTSASYRSGHIDGAVNIDQQSDSFESSISALDTSKTYFLYDQTGQKSALAAKALHDIGITHIYELEGGLNASLQSSQ